MVGGNNKIKQHRQQATPRTRTHPTHAEHTSFVSSRPRQTRAPYVCMYFTHVLLRNERKILRRKVLYFIIAKFYIHHRFIQHQQQNVKKNGN